MEKRIHTIPYDVESQNEEVPVSRPNAELSEVESRDRLLYVMQLLSGNWRLIRKIALWAAALTLIFALLTPNTYRSTTRLMPPEDQSGTKANLAMMAGMASKATGSGGSDLGMLAGDLLGSHTSGDLFVGILHSRTAQENIVDQFDLTSAYGIPWLHLRVQRDDACKRLEMSTETSQERKSGIISISVTDNDPRRAAALADGYVDQLNRLLATVSTSAAGRERQFLERRLTEVKKDLDESVAQLSQFSSKNTTFDPVVQGKATVEAVAALEGELIAAQSQLSGLQTIYTAENMRVRSLQARVTELRKQLDALSGRTGEGSSIPSLDASDSPLPFPSLRQLPLLGAKYADLFRRAKIQETVYQVLTQQYEMAKVQEAKEIPTVRVLDHPEVPLRKWGPHRGLLTLMGGVAGLLLGCLLVIGNDKWERWDVNDPRKVFFLDFYARLRRQRMWRWMQSARHKVEQASHDRWQKWRNNGSS